MKKKLKVHYTVQYVKEIELEINEEMEKHFEEDEYISYSEDNSLFYKLQELNENVLTELPIPEIYEDCGGDIRSIEYVDNSFEINYFEE
jgi:hypothetical protein